MKSTQRNMVGNFVNTHGHALRVYVCFAFVVETFQFPSGGNEDKKFHIEAIPARNDMILLHLKSRYGSSGMDGPMGDQGPPGIPGIRGLQGEPGEPGYCPVEICDAMQEARLLVSRLESLENFVKQHHVQFDAKSTSKSLMKLRITSDILFTKRNFTNDKTGLPGNVRVNIELKNTAPMIQHAGAFLVNSTVHLFDRSKVAKSQNSGTTESILRDGATKQQTPRHQQEVPSIKKSRIPESKNSWRHSETTKQFG